MITVQEEYLKRRQVACLPHLSDLHHHVMDRVFSEFSDGFSFDDAFAQIAKDPKVTQATAVGNDLNKVRLIVTRALDALVLVGMTRVEISDSRHYYRLWSPPTQDGPD